jgi:hypothetical protein
MRGHIVEFEEVSSKGKTSAENPEGSARTLVGLSPADHCGFDPAAGFNTFPYAIAPSAQKWKDVSADVIFA